MRKEKRVFIPVNHMPPSFPLNHTALSLLLCDYFSAPQWVWTLVTVWLVILWVGCIYDLIHSEKAPMNGYGRGNRE